MAKKKSTRSLMMTKAECEAVTEGCGPERKEAVEAASAKGAVCKLRNGCEAVQLIHKESYLIPFPSQMRSSNPLLKSTVEYGNEFPQVDLPKRDLGGPLLQLLLHVGGGLDEEPESDRGGMGRRQQAGCYRRRIGIAPS